MSKWYEFKASASGQETELLLYGEIGGFGISAESFMAALKQVPEDHHINLRIYSPGGSVFDGNVIFSALGRHKGGVTTHIDGLAASMASVIALAGSTVKMASNALYMIHNVSGSTYGDAEDMRKTADLLDKVQETLVATYSKKTKMPKSEIEDMMAEETWMTAKEAKRMGFVDEITSDVKMAAHFDLSAFKNAPKFDTPQNTTMIIETPEYLSLQAEHKTATAAIATLTADLEASVSANKDLNAKLNEATLNLEAAHASIENLKSERQKDATVHAVAIADFEKKVALASQNQLAATGTQPVDLGTVTGAVNHSDIYEAFSKADPIKAKEMFDNPETNKIIRAESKRRNTITK